MEELLFFWQHLPGRLSPVLLEFGSFQVRYYSLMYLIAFTLTYLLAGYRIRDEKHPYDMETIQDIMIWMILGLILGGRLGYVLFYNCDYYLQRPWEVFLPFDFSQGIRFVGISGMSFHGGALGALAAAIIFCRRRGLDFWRLADLFCPAIPLGYTFGRIGNFINGELYGRPTEVPWGMYFPLDQEGLLRHPSQLYEAFGEGILLFALLWSLRKRSPVDGFLLATYLMGYGLVRFFIEFYRQPDAQIGYLWGFLTMGQVLCLIMIGGGAGIMLYRKAKR
ncbi:MAG TPA: prolipoprotein diacylglyceryl transferase [Syntrophales bacterium]|nr:prolipoprotein diacylglyceryl transferase [Syntrophales bacterium]HOH73669.1 prolipoprotein diacylglyceryl transferase [Syntrophales bacterium]HPX80613.1 prolipoprotein diacylglyceryl transferase [Syntrophales bacterium]HQB14488.1 prolipoprotein diacylglyceryl transferase [Syntrophales bacterium]HQK79411.1 prolipoprotein diacylglyceryl transferase [Syntrophales bacterium]